MFRRFSKSLVLLLGLVALTPVCHSATRNKYRYFDDYLSHLDKKRTSLLITEKMEVEGSGEAETRVQADDPGEIGTIFSRPLPIRTGALRSKEVTCCMLGQLAGDKGYHCHVNFYAARLMARNYNRAHNRKIAGLQAKYAGGPAQKSSNKLMRTFQQCVTTSRGVIFHKCCQLEAIDKIPAKSTKATRRHYKDA